MKIYGYKGYDWEAEGFFFGIDPKVTLVPSIEPTVLIRPGSTPTFGISQVGTMNIVGAFGIIPYVLGVPSFAASLTGGPEGAFLYLFRKLAVLEAIEGQIRCQREDGVFIQTTGVLAVPNYASQGDVNIKDANFVIAKPWWEAANYTTGSSGF